MVQGMRIERNMEKSTIKSDWENLYKSGKQINEWPWSDLITFFSRYINLKKKNCVLELGCGVGNNVPFFERNKFKYYGIDASKRALTIFKKKFPHLRHNVLHADFRESFIFKEKFDIIFDRSSITQNSKNDISKVVKLISHSLVKNGIFIGIDWYSINSFVFKKEKKDRGTTLKNIKGKYFQGIGVANFSSFNQIKKFFKDFTFLHLEEKIINQKIKNNYKIAFWNFVVKKK